MNYKEYEKKIMSKRGKQSWLSRKKGKNKKDISEMMKRVSLSRKKLSTGMSKND